MNRVEIRPDSAVLARSEPYRWEGVEVLPYKEDGTHFRSISRQTLFHGEGDLPVEYRYFEIQPEGHSTLERHEHTHLVLVIRGQGEVLVGREVRRIGMHDVVRVPSQTWHQFRANQGEPLGFLCLVATERDRPHRPDDAEVAALRENPTVAEFIRV